MIKSLTHWTKYVVQPAYRAKSDRRRELEKIRSAPRHTPLSSNLLGHPLQIVDGASFCACFDEIFGRGIYAFTSSTDRPFIIDGGANVGVSVLYFKRMFPGSRVTAFEPDPSIFACLEANVRAGGFHDVELINKALWTAETKLEFWAEGGAGGRVVHGETPENRIAVQAVRLRDYLHETIDLLKLDIEGAETDVLLDCADLLGNVRRLFVEYHSFEGREQRLDVLITLLQNAGFRIYIQTEVCPIRPFVAATTYQGMDLQLNIFARRADQ